jgi:hypothetical protein
MQRFSSQETHQHPPDLPISCRIPLPPRSHRRIRSNMLVGWVVELGSVYSAGAKRVLMRIGLRVR